MAKHLEDFLDLSSRELKFYLQQRALPTSGTHSDLAARSLVAFEQDLPVKQSAEDLAKSLKQQHAELLKDYNLQQDPLDMFDWEEDVTKWPKTHIGHIFSYILEKKAFSAEYVGHYKTRKAYSYFRSGFAHQVFTKSVTGGNILIFSSVTASQRIREQPHKVWIVCKPSGEVLCGYCSCTAGFSKCCNHVIAVLYKVEFANQQGFTDPACTEQACSWNKSSRDIQPKKIKDMNIQAHRRENQFPKFALNDNIRQEFDPRPASVASSESDKQKFLSSIRQKIPDAVINISFSPPAEEDVPPTLQDNADKILENYPDAGEEQLVRLFSEELSFNEASIKEFEKATRGQSNQNLWIEQRKGRITASNYHDVYTKVKTLLRRRGAEVKTKITPLLVKLVHPTDLSNIPAIKWGRTHEKDASEAFFSLEGRKHKNTKLHICGLFISKSHPYLGASPDNIFSFSCCEPACIEYKCPHSIKDLSIEEGWDKTDFLEKAVDEIILKKSHKYYYQVQGQMGITGYKQTYFVVWTAKSPVHVEVIQFDAALWQDTISKLVVFFKTYVQRVVLSLRPICYCLCCGKPCIEPEEFEDEAENSIQCDSCQLWYHLACIDANTNLDSTFICHSCNALALDDNLT